MSKASVLAGSTLKSSPLRRSHRRKLLSTSRRWTARCGALRPSSSAGALWPTKRFKPTTQILAYKSTHARPSGCRARNSPRCARTSGRGRGGKGKMSRLRPWNLQAAANSHTPTQIPYYSIPSHLLHIRYNTSLSLYPKARDKVLTKVRSNGTKCLLPGSQRSRPSSLAQAMAYISETSNAFF